MKKLSILVVLLLMATLLQYCKKSDDTTTTALPLYECAINTNDFLPTTTTATITYTAATHTKVFNCYASTSTDRITLVATQPCPSSSYTGFNIASFASDSTTTSPFAPTYYTLSTNIFVTTGTLKSGTLTINTVDSVNNVISGNFNFNLTKLVYNGAGTVVAVTNTAIVGGQFNSLPYTFISK